MPEPRWETDARGIGVRDAAAFAEPVARLLDTMAEAGWIAEDPEAHLVPHLEAAAAALGLDDMVVTNVDDVLEIVLNLADRSHGERRATAHQLVASIAEASTHVRETRPGIFEVVTGQLPGDGSFATHGHVLRIRTTAP